MTRVGRMVSAGGALAVAVAVAAPAAAQQFGGAVAAEGGRVFVAEAQEKAGPGRVYVYERGADGAWEVRARLRAPDAEAGDGFGATLDVDGDLLLVGAVPLEEGESAAWVFEHPTDGSWRDVARLSPAEGASPGFGSALALADGWAFVGAWDADDARGTVYVWRRDAEGRWHPAGELEAQGVEVGGRFGAGIAADGDRVLVAAPRHDGQRGAAWVFRRGADGNWILESRLQPEELRAGQRFGGSVALRGDEALVGSWRFDGFRGAVFRYRFDPEAGEWRRAGRLMAFDGAEQDRFGWSLALDGDALWVGAPGADALRGRAYRLTRDPDAGEWTGLTVHIVEDLGRGGLLASALAADGGVAVAGAPGDDFGAGTAVVFSERGETRLAGDVDGLPPVLGRRIECEGGGAAGFECRDVDLVSFLPVRSIGGSRGVQLNDVWGWTDSGTGREYALVGRVDATAFVDISDPRNPVYLGELARTDGSPPSTWRDIKTYADHAFIVADGAGRHGMQVFDLTRLRDVAGAPVVFQPLTTYDGIASAHNIVINEETGFAFAVGASSGGRTCGGGLHMIDIRDPANPRFAGCFAHTGTGRERTGYTHDAQCVTYRGPDAEYRGREICFGSNETALSVADVTDKQRPVAIAAASYPGVAYSHQGWLTEDHRYFYMNDELDELAGSVDRTRTLVWDVSDLDDPILVGEHAGETAATDHNLYVRGDRMYQSNYVAGLRVLDISDPESPREIGYFDTVPSGGNEPGMDGSWSNYPFFESGVIVVTSKREGLFLVRPREPPPVS